MQQNDYKIYVLGYDPFTVREAKICFHNKSWANIISIDTTKYLENIMYDNWLLDHKKDWIEHKYVGTFSWRTCTKIEIPNLIPDLIESIDADVVAFSFAYYGLLENAIKSHGEVFKRTWYNILTRLNFTDQQIFDPTIKPFYCNFWMAKPNVMLEYIDFFARLKNIIENTQEIQEDLLSESNYTNYVTKNRLNKIYGRPYYPILPFILERIPCIFFHQKHKILLYNEY